MASEFEQSFISKLRRLSPEQQREVLAFVEALERTTAESGSGTGQRSSLEEIDALFKETQSLPQVRALTDDDIAAADDDGCDRH